MLAMLLTQVSGSGAIGVDHQQTDPFTPTAGQTAFTLTKTPVDPTDVKMAVNGVKYDNGSDFTISGTLITWTDPGGFTLKTVDSVEFTYNF